MCEPNEKGEAQDCFILVSLSATTRKSQNSTKNLSTYVMGSCTVRSFLLAMRPAAKAMRQALPTPASYVNTTREWK